MGFPLEKVAPSYFTFLLFFGGEVSVICMLNFSILTIKRKDICKKW
jgi:hypothetical protein